MKKKAIIYKKKLGQDIKQLCHEKGIQIPNLETLSGYSPGMISRWASSSDDEDFNVLSKLVTMANILDVSVDDLLGINKNTASLIQTENSNIFSALTEATINGNLTWHTLDIQKNQLPFGIQIPESESGRAVAEIWYTIQCKVSFVFVSYCDDLADFSEPLELILYGFVGHGIAPIPIHTTNQESLHTLYAYIQFNIASKLLSHIGIDSNKSNTTHPAIDTKHGQSNDKMIIFEKSN